MSIVETGRSNAVLDKLAERFLDENEELRGITRLILSFAPEYFNDIKGIVFKIFFTIKPLNDHAGYCKRLDHAVRFKLGVDYFILIDKTDWDKSNRIEKAKLVIHELHHIAKDDKGQPIIRKHNSSEDFCELPVHDLYSENVVSKLKDRLTQPALMEKEIEAE